MEDGRDFGGTWRGAVPCRVRCTLVRERSPGSYCGGEREGGGEGGRGEGGEA